MTDDALGPDEIVLSPSERAVMWELNRRETEGKSFSVVPEDVAVELVKRGLVVVVQMGTIPVFRLSDAGKTRLGKER